ncbi:MAG: hypothetical protein SCH98_06480 [Deferrisomatales bacterium]|nr:hypothetical protein [Deferrisomatales bacterium]
MGGLAVFLGLLLVQGCGSSGSSSSGQPDPGVPPVFGTLQNQVVEAGVPLEFQVTATHPEGEPVTIAADPRPRGAIFDGTTFRWTPEIDQARVHDVQFTATAGGLSASQWITITVNHTPLPPDEGEAVSDVFTQAVAQIDGEVDVLFVLDTSDSMRDKRATLGAEVPLILDQLTDVGTHRFAFLLAWGWPGLSNGYEGSGHLYQFEDNGWVLDSDLLSREEMVEAVAATLASEPPGDLSTDGGEAGLYAFNRLLTTHIETARDRDFLVPGRKLAVIFIADENDICAIYPPGVTPVPDPDGLEEHGFITYCVDPPVTPQTVYDTAEAVVGADNLLLTGLLYVDENTVPAGSENEVGYGYLEAIELSGGVPEELAAADFSGAAQRFGQAINALTADFQRRFLLREGEVNPESIVVLVDGVSLEPTQFRYELATHEVVLLDYAGSNGSTIQIQYRLLTP